MCLKIFSGTVERKSPGDWLPESAVRTMMTDNRMVLSIDFSKINVPGLTESVKIWYCPVPDTNSMDPVFDNTNDNILIAGKNELDHAVIVGKIQVGDIAVYKTDLMYAIHRVYAMGEDNQGKWYRFKGDNNPTADPDKKVRAEQILWVSVGTIY